MDVVPQLNVNRIKWRSEDGDMKEVQFGRQMASLKFRLAAYISELNPFFLRNLHLKYQRTSGQQFEPFLDAMNENPAVWMQ